VWRPLERGFLWNHESLKRQEERLLR
jgi:hypothetical protein